MKASLTQLILALAFLRSPIIEATESVWLTSLFFRFKEKYAKASSHVSRCFAALFLGTQFVMLSGCAGISHMVGHSEPNPTRIQVGDTRHQAEDILGQRLWRPGSADGLTCDVYEYEVERPAHPISGPVFLFVEVFLFGLPELASIGHNFTDVKQVAVAYDEQDRVRFVSKPWPVWGTADPCRRMRSLLPADSGVCSTAHPSIRDLPEGAALETATLELPRSFGGTSATVDGHKVEGRVVKLPPGRHIVNYYYYEFWPPGVGEVELFPGRFYRLKLFAKYAGKERDIFLFWIEDVYGGETLSCDWSAPG